MSLQYFLGSTSELHCFGELKVHCLYTLVCYSELVLLTYNCGLEVYTHLLFERWILALANCN